MSHRGDSSRLLYVEPDPAYQAKVASTCEPEWAVETADSVEEAMSSIDTVDCVVAADELPDRSSLGFLADVQAEDETLPFILFASGDDLNLQRNAFRAGVTDVIYKQGSTSEPADEPAEAEPDDRSDGIAGLVDRLAGLETPTVDLNGITLDVSRSLMGAADDEVDMKTKWALQSLAEQIEANQCLIYEVDDSDALSLLHGWTDDEVVETEIHRTLFGVGAETVPTTQFPGFTDQLQQFAPVCVDVTDLDVSTTDGGQSERGENSPEEHESAASEPVESVENIAWSDLSDEPIATDAISGTLLALPIVIEWQLSGVIVITVDRPREWTEEARQRLQAVGELVGHMERRRRQREELQRQNEQLEQFASVISHDLQNPLNVITGYLDLVMETGNVEQLDPAANAADRMERLLNDLLTLATEGRAVGDTEPTELEDVVTGAWESVETYEATLELVGFEDETVIEADESRLKEAFENLFKNAIVHAGKDVGMRVEIDDEMVYVADDGPGIPDDQQDKIFEHGHTGGNGTGLGLSIVQSIIEGHDWEIEAAESKEGGARFDIALDF